MEGEVEVEVEGGGPLMPPHSRPRASGERSGSGGSESERKRSRSRSRSGISGISLPLNAIIITAAMIAVTSTVAVGAMVYTAAAAGAPRSSSLPSALLLHETIEAVYLSNPGTSATVMIRSDAGPITAGQAPSGTAVTYPAALPLPLPDPAGIVASAAVGGALSLNGVNAYANVSTVNGLSVSAITVTFWSKQIGTKNFFMHPIAVFGGHCATVYVCPNSWKYYYKFEYISGVRYEGFFATLDDQWHFIAATFDGSRLKVYVDGTVKTNISAPGSISKLNDGIFLGATGTGSIPSANWFYGLIDDVLIFNRALNDTEVLHIYQNRSPMNSTGLVAWYKFDEGIPGTAVDSSGNGNNGTDVGSARALYGPTTVTYKGVAPFALPAGTCAVTVSKEVDGSVKVVASR